MPEKSDTAAVRPGEELPVERLQAYLLQHLPGASGPLVVEQFPHGHSNLTYLLRLGDQELVLRRPPFGNEVKTAHDMGREYKVLSHLCQVFPPAPRPYLYCDDASLIGVPFYVMERRRGLILRKNAPDNVAISPDAARQLSTALIDHLARLHMVNYRTCGLGDLGKPDGYVARQVAGWTKRYEQAMTDEVPAMDRAARWLAENLPAESGATLVHNDYKYDNVVFDPKDFSRVAAVLDWEMATVGDPLMDLGTTLGYWVQADDPEPLRQVPVGPTSLPGNLTRRELVERYEQQTGRTVTDPLCYYVYGLFKIAVIVQQIYARYARGLTRDGRFANLNHLVVVLSQQADRAIEAGDI